jgi:predicted XRE-type DNA-binding protein
MSTFMSAIVRPIKREGWTQSQAATVLRVTQTRISNLIHGKIDAFALDMPVKMAATPGMRVTLRVKKAA